ncbi:MAG: ATP-binding protein [Kiritimatiellae bacterium]|nr:ATP-binding protein [Kiritimatiellia bacterium]
MDFFGRQTQIEKLRSLRAKAKVESQFVILTGRRRVGKTELVKRAFSDEPFVYLFVSRKSEPDLVSSFVAEVNAVGGLHISEDIHTLGAFFEELFRQAEACPVTVFIDEFQDFIRVNPAAFSVLQGLWDRYHGSARLALVVCGSVHSLMTRIFQDRKEPLYGRGTALLRLEPFSPSELRGILARHNPDAAPEDLLSLWAVSGGIAKYVALLMDGGATDRTGMIRFVFDADSPFLDEGRLLLSDEFGHDSGTYFTILSAIARGATSRNEIEQVVGRPVGGHLTRLEEDYRLVEKKTPLFAKSSRIVRYALRDPFYRFWFRFVFRYDYMAQIGAWKNLRRVVLRDWDAFTGLTLERWFHARLAESGEWTRMGAWWDRKGNEIDIIAENEIEGRAAFFEVKRDIRRYDEIALRRKADIFLSSTGAFRGYALEYRSLSLSDM